MEGEEEVMDLKGAEETLPESEALSRAVIEHSPVGISIRDRDGVLLLVNEAWKKIWAMSDADIREEDARNTGRTIVERYSYLGDGARDAERMFAPEGGVSILYVPELEIKEPRPGAARWVSQYFYALRDGEGRMEKVVTLTQDITERKRLEEHVLHLQKMEAIGRLSGGVAHDFNNILQSIMGYAEMALLKVPEDDPLRKYLEGIEKAVDRAAALTCQLLTFSRKQVFQPVVIDFNEIVRDSEEMLRRLIGEDVEIVTRLDPEAGWVKVDPIQIEQVVMNLAVNARDAMPKGGRLTLETAPVELNPAFIRSHPGLAPGPHVMLTVTDTGCGMDAETLSHIFEPFFTTKEKGKGTGLGLSTVYGIVRQSGGGIEVQSAPGKGARFKIYFPREEEDMEALASASAPTELPKGRETILLAEDDDVLRDLTQEVLSAYGYTVVEAENGEAALRLFTEHPGPVHLLITDVVMPKMNGPDLARKLAPLHPELKVIFISGYPDEATFSHGLKPEGPAFLQKPFKTDVLLCKVREVLDGPNGIGGPIPTGRELHPFIIGQDVTVE